eukprot:scaffold1890_cov96-Cylindrotheca_fusiformis.AAC.2
MIWEYAKGIITMNNSAVADIGEGRFVQAQSVLQSALAKLQVKVFDPILRPNGSTVKTSEVIDAWMLSAIHTEQATLQRNLEGHDDLTCFFLHRKAVVIPLVPCNHQDKERTRSYFDAVRLTVVFNLAIAYHLYSNELLETAGNGRRKARTTALKAIHLYKAAMQHPHDQGSCRFILAACNNLAVLDLQWIEASGSRNRNKIGRYFGFQKILLCNFCLRTPSSSPQDEEVRNKLWENIQKAKFLVQSKRCQHAAAA